MKDQRKLPSAVELTGVLAAAVIAALLCYWHSPLTNDDAYITYRYAQNLASGQGFVFNVGENVLGTTAPLYGLLLGLLGLANSDIVMNGLILGWFSVVLLVSVVYLILKTAGMPLEGFAAAGLVLLSARTYSVLALETVFLTVLLFLCVLAAQRRAYTALAACGAVAVLTRADAALMLAVLYLYLAAVELRIRPARFLRVVASGLLSIALTIPWFLYSLTTYGTLFANTASAKTGWPGHSTYFAKGLLSFCLLDVFRDVPALAPVTLLLASVGLLSFWRLKNRRFLLVLPAWSLVYVAVYTALRIFWPHHWYYFPVYVVLCIAFSAGGLLLWRSTGTRRRKLSTRAAALGALMALLTAMGTQLLAVADYPTQTKSAFFGRGRYELNRALAQWLNEDPRRCPTVAALEIGILGYYSQRTIIDRMGLVTPAAGVEMKRTRKRRVSAGWTLQHYSPSCFVVASSGRVAIPPDLQELTDYRLLHPPFVHVPSDSFLLVLGADP